MDASRTLATAVAVAALAAPAAHAANSEAPGILKKQDAASERAPAPVAPLPQSSEPVAPAPTVESAPEPAKSETKSNAKVPLNQGTTRKRSAQPTEAPSTTSAPSTAGSARTTRRRARRSSRSAHRTGTRSSRTRARSRRGTGSAATGGGTVASKDLPEAGVAGSGQRHAARQRAKAPVVPPTENADAGSERAETTLGSISRAADSVVEVIPGTVVLALAGLAALVLMLILRSWVMERRRLRALAASYGITVESLATAIEAKDHTTGGHIERVRRLGLLLAREVAPSEARDPQMAYGFLLHDIGKLAVPDAILRAPGRLTEQEWSLMRRHPEEGARMLAQIPFLDRALDVVRHHHERWDGGGYPGGLSGEQIPLWARIFSVADALDAMTAARPYRPARSYADALEEIRRHAGTQFDPAVVEALERIDPVLIEPLLEPSQQLDAELAPEPIPAPAAGPLVAA